MAKTIPARWFSLLLLAALLSPSTAPAQARKTSRRAAPRRARPAAKAGDLASLVRAWRDSASPAKRAAVEAYAAAHTRDNTGALARLALGVGAYEQRDFAVAIAAMRKVGGKLPQVADYLAYYLAASRLELNDTEGIAKDLLPVHSTEVRSPLSGKAWVTEARAIQATDPAAGARLLRDHYSELSQPDGDLALADCYRAANDLNRAADFYQRIYSQYLSGATADRASAALLALRDSMGAAYPAPLPEQMLHRADRLVELREYSRARAEYLSLAGQLAGVPRDRARVRTAVADYRGGKTAAAYQYLRALDLPASEADAERLYYLAECARRLSDDDEMMTAVRRLDRQYPQSPWRLKALITAANRYLLVNRPDDYLPLYKAAYQDFPSDPGTGLCHWKVAFQAYLRDRGEAAGLLREHLRTYPLAPTAGAAMYFLGRLAERAGDLGSARAFYQRLSGTFENHYYAMLARGRLARTEVARAAIPAAASAFLAEVKLAEAKPVPAQDTRETTLRISRSRLLRIAGLSDLADGELRFGARTGGQPQLLGMELAAEADAPNVAMRIMKNMSPEYLNLKLDQAPRRFWELLFPLPYRSEVTRSAQERHLDPYLIAGLIRQESEFNAQALSSAHAYGLTQVRPGTGRSVARKLGIRFTNRVLFQPAANLKIGSAILRSMLDQNGGQLEQTLAAYNAGPNRLAEWIAWNNYREPAEFVESIPFTETRDYVQAVLRNADVYRRLYK